MSDGAVFAYGGARNFGSLYGHRPAGGVAAIAATPDLGGYWLVSRDGGVFTFGNARFFGSIKPGHLNGPVVGLAPTRDGLGYWIATADGGVYCFGDAAFAGSLSPRRLATPVVGVATSRRGGYWLVTAAGAIFSFGGARYFGSLPEHHGRISAIAARPQGDGYWLTGDGGNVYAFGAAAHLGSAVTDNAATVSAIAVSLNGRGFVLGSSRLRAPHVTLHSKLLPAEAPTQYLGSFLITCYDLTGLTASGALAGPQSVAVDPAVIPLGARIFIDGVGSRTADDTGGGIIGAHVDIWEPSYDECIQWGAQHRAVYLQAP